MGWFRAYTVGKLLHCTHDMMADGVGGGLASMVLDTLQYTHDMVLGVGGGLGLVVG